MHGCTQIMKKRQYSIGLTVSLRNLRVCIIMVEFCGNGERTSSRQVCSISGTTLILRIRPPSPATNTTWMLPLRRVATTSTAT